MAIESAVTENSDVTSQRKELEELTPRYDLIRHVITQSVPDRGELYLPCPSGVAYADRSPEEIQRYKDYSKRAIFYNYTGRTLSGFIGQIYSRDPEIKVDPKLAAVEKDANGNGLSLLQLSKEACAEALSVGRVGLFVDYPNPEPGKIFTKKDMDDGIARPTIKIYLTEEIINWRTKKRGAKNVLSLVVLHETYIDESASEFNPEEKDQWRVLDLDADGFYRVRVYRESDGWGTNRTTNPIANEKKQIDIPFTFIGAINNDPQPDQPPMYDLAKINIGHYRNSADNEDSIFYSGQPTYVVNGVSENWFTKIMKGVIKFGSRNGLALEKDADAKIIQADPNTVVAAEMKRKEEQMAAMGADFLKEQSVAKTATEAALDDSSKTSVISTVAANVSAGFQFALEWAAIFQGVAENSVSFKLNSQFDLTRLTSQDRAQIVKDWQAGAISWTELRSAYRKAGIATEPDAKVKTELDNAKAADIENAATELRRTLETQNELNNGDE